MEPTGFALLAEDASVNSAFREIHVPRVWPAYLATGFDFRPNNCAGWGSIEAATLPSASYLATTI